MRILSNKKCTRPSSCWASVVVYYCIVGILSSTTVVVNSFTTTTITTPWQQQQPTLCKARNFGHDYERDRSDVRPVDVDAVNDLLSQRLQARKEGDFKVADQLRDELKDRYEVTVFDKDRIWATSGGNREIRNRGGQQQQQQRRSSSNSSNSNNNQRGRGNGRFLSFGPTGHDYSLDKTAGPSISNLSETEIHAGVADRLRAKMNRDFASADQIQLRLAETGVFVSDRTKEWRADGVQFIDPSEGRKTYTPSDRNRPYVQSQDSEAVTEDTIQIITKMVAERALCKRTKKYREADGLRDALQQNYNVILDDRVRQWSVGGSFGIDTNLKRAQMEAKNSRGYVQSNASLQLPEGITKAKVQAAVDERTRLKQTKQYEESDVLRDQILQEYNVVLHDKIKMWSVGGDFGKDDPIKARAQARSTFTRRGGGRLSEQDVSNIQQLLEERFEAKRARDFGKADAIRSELYDVYNVNVDDKSNEWRVLSEDYAQTRPEKGATRRLTNDEVRLVETIIMKRAILKKEKAYEKADAIREKLEDTYSVVVDDKKKEWRVAASSGRNNKRDHFSAPRDQKQLYEELKDKLLEDESSVRGQQIIKDRIDAQQQQLKEETKDDVDDDTTTLEKIDVKQQQQQLIEEMKEDIDDNTTLEKIDEVKNSDDMTTTTASREELMSLTIPLLKEKLREVGKPVSGKKAVLIDRLLLLQ